MKIHFVSHADNTFASKRMRVIKFSELLNKRGHEATFSDTIDVKADLNVFNKHLNPLYDQQMLQILKQFGKKTCFDICDPHFLTQEVAEHYYYMSRYADIITISTPNMEGLVKYHTKRDDIKLIKDPITFPEYTTKVNLDNPKILWFGHALNLPALFEILPQLKDYNVTVVSNHPLPEQFNWVNYIEWKENLVEYDIWNYDICIIPVGTKDPLKNYKSTNRAVDSLIAGRYVITDSEEVYGELAPFMWVGGSIIEGIKTANRDPERILKAIKDGQSYVREIYSDVVISDQLEAAYCGINAERNRELFSKEINNG